MGSFISVIWAVLSALYGQFYQCYMGSFISVIWAVLSVLYGQFYQRYMGSFISVIWVVLSVLHNTVMLRVLQQHCYVACVATLLCCVCCNTVMLRVLRSAHGILAPLCRAYHLFWEHPVCFVVG